MTRHPTWRALFRTPGMSINTVDVNENEIAELVGPLWSSSRVMSDLRVTTKVLATWQESGEVLWLVTGEGVTVYPAWQFWRHEDAAEVRPALVDVFRALRRHDGWATAVLLHTPAPELDDMTPLDWLRDGRDPGRVRELARVVAREWGSGAAP